MTNNKNIHPFVKWAGGKRQILSEINKRKPKNFKNYFEPFVGGGAVLFDIQPENSFINDINVQLIHTYNVIKYYPNELIKLLNSLDNMECDKECYYEYRNKFNYKIENKIFDVELAALFIYINKRCFNGLYRVNSKGLFNVPFNGKIKAKSFEESNILDTSLFLQNVIITADDFEIGLKLANKGDFVFIDSPYAPLNPTSFESYTDKGFSVEEHERLAKVFKELDEKGCFVMLTNHNTEFIRELYKDYLIEEISVKRMINSDSSNRKGKEVIIRNYGI